MTGDEFVVCAERLARSSAEADLRSAVSRAYFGAFHAARSLLQDSGVRLPKTEQVHVKVGFCLQDCGEANAGHAGQQLEVLRLERRRADYDLDDGRFTDGRKARSEVARARDILGALDLCRIAPAATDFKTKVRTQAKLLGLMVAD
jgi:uncharacterized protein (UPF0332 family)